MGKENNSLVMACCGDTKAVAAPLLSEPNGGNEKSRYKSVLEVEKKKKVEEDNSGIPPPPAGYGDFEFIQLDEENGCCGCCALTEELKMRQSAAIEDALIGRLPDEKAQKDSFEGITGIINILFEIEFMLISYIDAFTDYISIDVMYQNGLYGYMYPAIAGLVIQMLCEFAGAVETIPSSHAIVGGKSKMLAKNPPSLEDIETRGMNHILTPLLIVLRLKIAYEGFVVISSQKKSVPYLSYKIVDAIFRTYTQNVIQLIVFFNTYDASSSDSSLTTLLLAVSIIFALLNLAQTVVTNMVPWLSPLTFTYVKLFLFFSCEVTLRFLTIAIVVMSLDPILAAIVIGVDIIVRTILVESMEERRVLKGLGYIHHIRPVFLKLLLQSVTDYTPDSVLLMCVTDDRERYEKEVDHVVSKRGTADYINAEVSKCFWSMAGGGLALYLYANTDSTALQTIAAQGSALEIIMIAALAAKAMVVGYIVVPFSNKSAYSYLMIFAVIGAILGQTYNIIFSFFMSLTPAATAAAAALVKALLDRGDILGDVQKLCIVVFAIIMVVYYIISPLISWFW